MWLKQTLRNFEGLRTFAGSRRNSRLSTSQTGVKGRGNFPRGVSSSTTLDPGFSLLGIPLEPPGFTVGVCRLTTDAWYRDRADRSSHRAGVLIRGCIYELDVLQLDADLTIRCWTLMGFLWLNLGLERYEEQIAYDDDEIYECGSIIWIIFLIQ